ncbi:hypothetical protein [Caryophanon latum]|uniref:SH3b domain-containing protein n=1 Tax=Caryophanon latum TaxID=33977 RepID=A0A1C0YIX0_9BACL|nr:hypothetical protein [Caryophanon latum]OCS87125.1 hypothetical protein A6K76_13960 [Caryophanon latum]
MKKWLLCVLLLLAVVAFPTFVDASNVREVKVVNANSLAVKGAASPSVADIASLQRGDLVIISATGNGWAKIQSKSIAGYVNESYLQAITPIIKVITANGLVVKQYPTRSANTTATWQKGLLVEDYGSVGAGWNVVKYGDGIGYAAASSMTAAKAKTQYVHADQLVMRNTATKSGVQLATLPKNTKVTTYGTIAGWAYVAVGNMRGYVVASELHDQAVTVIKGERIHQGDLSKTVRFTTTLRDATTGKNIKAHLISYGDYSGYGNDDNIWAGLAPGDLYYEGDFKIGLQAEGDKYVYIQPYSINDYTYNKTAQLVYKVQGKTSKDTDLFMVSKVCGSNCREATIFYVTNGQLSRAGIILYTAQPKSIGNNEYQEMVYSNAGEVGYHFSTFKLDPKASSIKYVRSKSFMNDQFDDGSRIFDLWLSMPNYVVK